MQKQLKSAKSKAMEIISENSIKEMEVTKIEFENLIARTSKFIQFLQ